MIPELETLWNLHAFDESLAAVRMTLNQVPERLRQLDERVNAERTRLDQIAQRLGDAQKQRRGLEREIEALEQQQRKFESQLPAIKKNEEYQALLTEIATCKSKGSDLETRVLIELEQEEALGRERVPAQAALAAAEQERGSRRTVLEQAAADARTRGESLEAERRAQIEALPPATRSRYERIAASREGRAVVAIQKGACGGCFRALPPQVLAEARKHDRLLFCEGCGRIVILPPES